MRIEEIRAIAAAQGVKPAHLNKVELVRAIQRAEHNFDCFGKAVGRYCDQYGCLWRHDCLHASTKSTNPQ